MQERIDTSGTSNVGEYTWCRLIEVLQVSAVFLGVHKVIMLRLVIFWARRDLLRFQGHSHLYDHASGIAWGSNLSGQSL